jgi:hypothetical protein
MYFRFHDSVVLLLNQNAGRFRKSVEKIGLRQHHASPCPAKTAME